MLARYDLFSPVALYVRLKRLKRSIESNRNESKNKHSLQNRCVPSPQLNRYRWCSVKSTNDALVSAAPQHEIGWRKVIFRLSFELFQKDFRTFISQIIISIQLRCTISNSFVSILFRIQLCFTVIWRIINNNKSFFQKILLRWLRAEYFVSHQLNWHIKVWPSKTR